MSDAWAARTGLTAILITVPELADFTDRWRSVVSLTELGLWREGDDGAWRQFGAVSL